MARNLELFKNGRSCGRYERLKEVFGYIEKKESLKEKLHCLCQLEALGYTWKEDKYKK